MPIPAQGEVLLRVKRVGRVRHRPAHLHRHPALPLVPAGDGPRALGLVEKADADCGLAAGDAVYVMPYLSCGSCVACRQGKTNCCVRIQVLGVHRDGAFTEYLCVPRPFVHKAEGITLDQAAMLEFLAIGAHAVRRGDVGAGQRVLVVGAGPIGLATAMFARLRGAHVTVIDGRRDRLEFCAEAGRCRSLRRTRRRRRGRTDTPDRRRVLRRGVRRHRQSASDGARAALRRPWRDATCWCPSCRATSASPTRSSTSARRRCSPAATPRPRISAP